MRIDKNAMKKEERATLALRGLYQQYGYKPFKMGKFEPYDLYVRNRDFISSDRVITFSDMNGRLMALKPDLTLSIVKNYREFPGCVEKVYYSENIYRASKSAKVYKEILQTGLECIGELDLYHICEVTLLAAKSLGVITEDYVLEVSHMGLIKGILNTVEEETRAELIKCIGEKNLHEIRDICRACRIEQGIAAALELLISTYGSYDKVLPALSALCVNKEAEEAVGELGDVCRILEVNGLADNINIDFSIVNDLNYYSGILFKGFIRGIPESILSGGRYDKLMERMGKSGGAIGFALYLDALDVLERKEKKYDVDVAFIYDRKDDIAEVLKAAKAIRETGKTVSVERTIPPKVTYEKMVKLEEGKVVCLEDNA
ncbi:MAG: ATP phosphoribosyltransferase regulatory subunit [Emergencia sp.]|nr:ATP phosphoribosyltransferase regulatory subunit [Emergencia sp.]